LGQGNKYIFTETRVVQGKYYIVGPLILLEAKKIEKNAKKTNTPFITCRYPFKDSNKRETVRKILKKLQRDYQYLLV